MLCDFKTTEIEPGVYLHECQRDGCRVSRTVNSPTLVRACNVVGAGDAVKWALDKAGIKIRKNCGCEGRRKRMNEIGEKVKATIKGAFGLSDKN